MHTRTRFCDNRLRQSSNVGVITTIILEAAGLVCLLGRFCEPHLSGGFRWHDVHPKFLKDRFRRSELGMGEYICRHTDANKEQGDLNEPTFIFSKINLVKTEHA